MARTRTVNGIEYPVSDAHPAAEVLPWMSDAELVMLAEDIKAKGQLVPIDRTPDNRIIDGRNRELACRIAGVEPDYQRCHFTEAQIVGHVVSLNVPRRHLTPSQRAMVAAEFANMLKGEKVNASEGDRQRCLSPEQGNISQAKAAEMMDVSVRSVRSAKAVQQQAPELVEPIKEGKIDVHTAAKVAKLPEPVRQIVVESPDLKAAANDALAAEAIAREMEREDAEAQPEPEGVPLFDDLDGGDDEEPEPEPDAPRSRQTRKGNWVSPNHPFVKVLNQLQAISTALTKAMASDESGRLKKYLTALYTAGELKFPQLVSHRALTVEGKHYGAQFVGFRGLRRIILLAGLLEEREAVAKKVVTVYRKAQEGIR